MRSFLVELSLYDLTILEYALKTTKLTNEIYPHKPKSKDDSTPEQIDKGIDNVLKKLLDTVDKQL
jgi:hypothetical protein